MSQTCALWLGLVQCLAHLYPLFPLFVPHTRKNHSLIVRGGGGGKVAFLAFVSRKSPSTCAKSVFVAILIITRCSRRATLSIAHILKADDQDMLLKVSENSENSKSGNAVPKNLPNSFEWFCKHLILVFVT